MSSLKFEALHYPERLHLVNPFGDVGVIILWSPLPTAKRRLEHVAPGILDPARSRVAVIANLYGDGMYAMFCNLLHNPQIRHLVAVGQDLGLPTCQEIEAFLAHGLEDTVMLGTKLKRIVGTGRVFPSIPEFNEHRLRETLSFRHLGTLSGDAVARELAGYLDSLPRHTSPTVNDRVRVEMPQFSVGEHLFKPSALAGHQVVRRRPLDCWRELIVRAVRFGHPVMLGNGPRLELLNAKVVITEPQHEPRAVLAQYGFQLDRFLKYQEKMLQPERPEGISYTYGSRLLGHFGRGTDRNTLQWVIARLRADPESRRSYIALWDTTQDLSLAEEQRDSAVPCLTTLFFRRVDDRLSLSATFRSHSLLTAWLENVYGLMAVQRHVAVAVGMAPGPITVISHSLGVDPSDPRYELARTLEKTWVRDDDLDDSTGRHELRVDPNGYFVVSFDEEEGCIVAEHRFGGLLIKRYRSNRAARIEREIGGDMAVSLVSHALWLGRELATKEQLLRDSRAAHASPPS